MAGQFDRLGTLLGIKLLLDEPLASLDISRKRELLRPGMN